MLVHICKVWPSLQSFHHGGVHFVCYPLLVDETSPTTAKNSGLRPKVRTNHLSFGYGTIYLHMTPMKQDPM